MIKEDKLEPGKEITTVITPSGSDKAGVKFFLGGHATYKPFMLSGFEDEVASKPQFTVKPYENDPTKLFFEWVSTEKDMWYGYIIVDYETITNKYHKMVHIPNFTTLEKYKDFGGYNYASGANSGFKWYNYNQNTSGELTLSNHMVADFEGICGVTPTFANTNYMRFDGHNIEFDTLVGDKKYTYTNREALSVMFHMKTTSTPTGEAIDVLGICKKDNKGNNVLRVKLN